MRGQNVRVERMNTAEERRTHVSVHAELNVNIWPCRVTVQCSVSKHVLLRLLFSLF